MGCLYILFIWPIKITFTLIILGFKMALLIIWYGTLYFLRFIRYVIKGIFNLLFGVTVSSANCSTGEEYEQACCKQLKQRGFSNVKTTARTGDHGIDILANRAGKKYAIQCKYYSNPVGNHAVQEALSGCKYYNCDIPVVLTNSTFTHNAIDEAEKVGVQLWPQGKIPF